MHVGLVCPDMTGHLYPSLALGRGVARRGHRVSVFTSRRARDRVERAGLEFVAAAEQDDAALAAALDRLARMNGLSAAMFTAKMIRIGQDNLLRDLPAAVRGSGVEGLIIDQTLPAGAVVAERLGLPYVVICNALAMCHDPSVPAPAFLWKYRRGRVWRWRNRLAVKCFRPVFDRVAGVTTGGVSPLMLMFEPHLGLACLAQQPVFLDFPREAMPDHFHYTGPWHESGRDDAVDFPRDRLDGRPLVYASMGTLQNNLRHVTTAILEAARGLDAQLVLTLGRTDASLNVIPPENAIVVPFAPQLRLLDRAAAAITHAGLNTALECLSRGVPMVCLPVTNDQPGVARRVEWVGAGEVLPVRRVTAARLRQTLTRVLETPSYAEAARRCRDEITAANGVAVAADIIERALTRRGRVLRPAGVTPA